MTGPFSYREAFDRNLGWFTEDEQERLRGKTIAIAGMGGVGGVHLLTLARLGVAGFHIADLDSFELANFNRQVGATMSTIGEGKTSVLARMAQGHQPRNSHGSQVSKRNLTKDNVSKNFFRAWIFLSTDLTFFVLGDPAKDLPALPGAWHSGRDRCARRDGRCLSGVCAGWHVLRQEYFRFEGQP